LKALHKKEVVIVRNGYDTDLADVNKLLSDRASRSPNENDKIQIVYTGNYYRAQQDPRPLFRAIHRLADLGEIGVDQLNIDFYGSRLDGLREAVSDCDVEQFVNILGPVSRRESLELQKRASAVLLLEAFSTTSGGILPGKVFEYMASGTPVICVGDGSDLELSGILERTGVGVSFGADEAAIAQAVLQIISQRVPNWFDPNFESVREYSRTASAQKMFASIRRRVEASTPVLAGRTE